MILVGAISFGIFCFVLAGRIAGAPGAGRRGSALPALQHREVWLRQAGIHTTPGRFRVGLIAIFATVFLVLTAATGVPLVAVVPGLACVYAAVRVVDERRRANQGGIEKLWPEALDQVATNLESGSTVHGALVQLSFRGPRALQIAFEHLPTTASTSGLQAALEETQAALPDVISQDVISVLVALTETDGKIALTVVRDLRESLITDFAQTTEAESTWRRRQSNALRLLTLPWMGLAIVVLLSDASRNLYDSGAGAFVASFAFVVLVTTVRIVTKPVTGSAERKGVLLLDDSQPTIDLTAQSREAVTS